LRSEKFSEFFTIEFLSIGPPFNKRHKAADFLINNKASFYRALTVLNCLYSWFYYTRQKRSSTSTHKSFYCI